MLNDDKGPYRPKRHQPRNLLHRDKLMFFRHWVLLPVQGYIEHPKTSHAYEVLRISKYTPQGDNPHIVFYQKDLPTQHVTCDKLGQILVRKWLRQQKPPSEFDPNDKFERTYDERFEMSEALLNGEMTLPQWFARMKDLGFDENEAESWLDKQ